jgi:serine/threonine-protein kinase
MRDEMKTRLPGDPPAGASDDPLTERPALDGPGFERAEDELEPGSVLFGEYEVLGLIGRGGMGAVYRARHRRLGGQRAIKVMSAELSANPVALELFQREASALLEVQHDAVVRCHDLLSDASGRVYLIMELVVGSTLTRRLAKNGPLSRTQVRVLARRVLLGLAAAHARGVVHRDLAPDNIVLLEDRVELAKIIDFGIAKLTTSEERTVIEGFKGKLAYASPEQLGLFGGRVDARSDLYSLGLVLAEAATGRRLGLGSTLVDAFDSRRDLPQLPRGTGELREPLLALLAPDPDARPESAQAALALFEEGFARHLPELRRGAWVAGALACAVSSAFGLLYAFSSATENPGADLGEPPAPVQAGAPLEPELLASVTPVPAGSERPADLPEPEKSLAATSPAPQGPSPERPATPARVEDPRQAPPRPPSDKAEKAEKAAPKGRDARIAGVALPGAELLPQARWDSGEFQDPRKTALIVTGRPCGEIEVARWPSGASAQRSASEQIAAVMERFRKAVQPYAQIYRWDGVAMVFRSERADRELALWDLSADPPLLIACTPGAAPPPLVSRLASVELSGALLASPDMTEELEDFLREQATRLRMRCGDVEVAAWTGIPYRRSEFAARVSSVMTGFGEAGFDAREIGRSDPGAGGIGILFLANRGSLRVLGSWTIEDEAAALALCRLMD